MKIKRICAYIVDFTIISIISTFIFFIFFKNTAYSEYLEKNEYYVHELSSSGSTEFTEEELVSMLYDINKVQIPKQIIEFGLTIFYFGILSFILNGQTLGKRLMRLRVVPTKGRKLNAPLYFLREIILTNSILSLLAIINITLCGQEKWYLFNSIITNGKTIIVIGLLMVLIFNEEDRSLHDIICKTKVIEESK